MKKNNTIFIIAIITLIIIISILLISFLNNPKGSFTKLTYNDIKEKIENKEDFVLVVSQSTCSHCATYKPKIEIIAKDYGLEIYYIDIDLEKDKDKLLEDLKLNGATPTTLFFNKGKEKSILNRLEGDLSTEIVIKELKQMGFIEK